MTLKTFPVQGGARYENDWGFPRSGGRTHEGTDLFGAIGTPLLAVEDGDLRFSQEGFGGNVAYLRGVDGVTYFYAHLSGYEGQAPRAVKAGDVIGYLGKTGNAETTEPHLHFGVYQGGAQNPFPLLQQASVASGRSGVLWGLGIAAVLSLGAYAYLNPSGFQRALRLKF